MLAVLAVIAILAGATVVGGTLLAGNAVTVALTEEESPEPSESPTEQSTPSPTPDPTPTEEPSPTEEPTEEPTEPGFEDPEDLLTAEEVVTELRRDHDIDQRVDTTEEHCEEGGEDEEDIFGDLFACTSAVDTDLVRVIAFDSSIIAGSMAQGMGDSLDDGDAIDVQDACHVVLVWFEENNTDQDQRDEIVADAEEAIGCPEGSGDF